MILSEKAKIACKIHDEYAAVKDMVQAKDTTEHQKPHTEKKSTALVSALQNVPPAGQGEEKTSRALVSVGGGTKQQSSTAIMQQRKASSLPKPQWHPPWKLMRVSNKQTYSFPYMFIVSVIYIEDFAHGKVSQGPS